MRVGINTLFLIPGEVGGSQTYLRETMRAILAEPGTLRFTVFTNAENDAYLRELFGEGGIVRYHSTGVKASGKVARILFEQFRLPFRLRREKIDVLWSPGYTAPLFCRCPQVVTIHDMQYKRFPEDMSLLSRLARNVLVGGAAARCDAVLAVSEFAKTEILRFTSAGDENVRRVYEGVSLAFGEQVVADTARCLERMLGSDAPYILCVADTYPHKNIGLLAEAFAQLADEIPHRLVLVGNKRRGERAVERAIAGVGDGERVKRLRRLSQEEILTLYRCADLFVLPSSYEGLGLPVLEAMMAGTPVLTARRGALPEIGADAVRYVEDVTVESIAAGIREALGMPKDDRDKLLKAARQRAMQFTWARTARGTVEVFNSARSSTR